MPYLRAVTNAVKAHIALLGANIFYGAGFTVAKSVMPHLVPPLGFIFMRVSIVMVLFWLSWFGGSKYRAAHKFSGRDWSTLALGGLFGVAINQMLTFVGLNLTFPIHAALIMMSTPLLITIAAAILLRERIGWDKRIGLVIGIAGAFLLMGAGQVITASANTALGDLLILVNAASYATYLVIIKPMMQRYRPIIVIRWVFLFGFLYSTPFCWQPFTEIEWHRFTIWNYSAVAFIVICVTFFTYLWNIYALRHLTPSTAGAYIYLQPFFAAVISVVFTGEDITWVKVIATLLIFTGVYLVNFGYKKGRLHG